MFVVDLQADKLVAAHSLEESATREFLSPNGKLFATHDGHGTVSVRKAATGEVVRVVKGHRQQMWSTVFSGDGRRLLAMSCEPYGKSFDVRIWDRELGMGHELHQLTVGRRTRAPALSPDGKLWAIYDGDAKEVQVRKVEEERVIYRVPGQGLDNSWAETVMLDESLLLLNTNKSAAERWQLTGELVWRIERDGSRSSPLGIAPAGNRLLMQIPGVGVQLYDLSPGSE